MYLTIVNMLTNGKCSVTTTSIHISLYIYISWFIDTKIQVDLTMKIRENIN